MAMDMTNMTPKVFRLLRRVDGVQVATVGSMEAVKVTLEVLGYEYLGARFDAADVEVLQGAPLFVGLLGPAWDGDAVLYVEA